MRTRVTPLNQIMETRAASGNRLNWIGQTTHAVGGLAVYGTFANNAPSVLTIDDTVDWRDRLLVVTSFIEDPPNQAIPGQSDWLIFPRPRTGPGSTGASLKGELFYTAKGWTGTIGDARGGAGLFNYAQWIKNSDGTYSDLAYLYADRLTGQLKVALSSGCAAALMITASEQTGLRIAVP